MKKGLGSIEACTGASRNQFQHQRRKIVDDADSNSVSFGTGELDEPIGACASISLFKLERRASCRAERASYFCGAAKDFFT